MSSCPTRRCAFLLNKEKCLLAQPGHVFLSNKKTCLLVQQGCWARRNAFSFNGKTCLLVEQDNISYGLTRRHFLLLQQEDLSSCWARRNVFLFSKKRCLLVEQEEMTLCLHTLADPPAGSCKVILPSIGCCGAPPQMQDILRRSIKQWPLYIERERERFPNPTQINNTWIVQMWKFEGFNIWGIDWLSGQCLHFSL